MHLFFERLDKRLKKIRAKVEEAPPPDSLFDALLMAYMLHVLDRCTELQVQYKDLSVKQDTAAPASKQEEAPEDVLVKQATEALASNWEMVKCSCLSYTALPDHPVTILWILTARAVADYQNRGKWNDPKASIISAFPLLMPGIHQDSIAPDKYLDLIPWWKGNEGWQDIDLRRLIRTHISSADGTNLIPVNRITEISSNNPEVLLRRAYQDIDHCLVGSESPNDSTILSQEEFDRLVNFNTLTDLIFAQKQKYNRLTQNSPNLLGELLSLTRALLYNSKNTHGIGSELIAGETVYDAIAKYVEFYNGLPADEKDKIPTDIRKITQRLMNCSSNKKMIGHVLSCISTMRQGLRDAMRNNSVELSKIVLSPQRDDISPLVRDCIENLRQNSIELTNRLANAKSSLGCDRLGVTTQSMKTLDMELIVNSFGDILLLKGMTGEELAPLFQSEEFCCDITRFLETPKQLAALARAFKRDGFETLLSAIALPFYLLRRDIQSLLPWLQEIPRAQQPFFCSTFLPFFLRDRDKLTEIFLCAPDLIPFFDQYWPQLLPDFDSAVEFTQNTAFINEDYTKALLQHLGRLIQHREDSSKIIAHFSASLTSRFIQYMAERNALPSNKTDVLESGSLLSILCTHDPASIRSIAQASYTQEDTIISRLFNPLYQFETIKHCVQSNVFMQTWEQMLNLLEWQELKDPQRLLLFYQEILSATSMTKKDFCRFVALPIEKPEAMREQIKNYLPYLCGVNMANYGRCLTIIPEQDLLFYLPALTKGWLIASFGLQWRKTKAEHFLFLRDYPEASFRQLCHRMSQTESNADYFLHALLLWREHLSEKKRTIFAEVFSPFFGNALQSARLSIRLLDIIPVHLFEKFCKNHKNALINSSKYWNKENCRTLFEIPNIESKIPFILPLTGHQFIANGIDWNTIVAHLPADFDKAAHVRNVLDHMLADYIQQRENRSSSPYLHFYSHFFGLGNSLQQEKAAVEMLRALLSGQSVAVTESMAKVLLFGGLGDKIARALALGYGEPLGVLRNADNTELLDVLMQNACGQCLS